MGLNLDEGCFVMNGETISDWDISSLVGSTNPEAVRREFSEVKRETRKFQERYKGRIEGFHAEELRSMLKELEHVWNFAHRIWVYCRINFMENADNADARALDAFGKNTYADTNKSRAFVELEIARLLKKNPGIIKAPQIQPYIYYLEQLRVKSSHKLSESEEKIIIDKNRYGSHAWSKLHGEIRATSTEEIEIDGHKKRLTLMELYNFTKDSLDRELRKRAAKACCSILRNNGNVLASAYRSISGNYVKEMELRCWPDPLSPFLHNEGIERKTLETMIQVVVDNKPIVKDYLELKCSLLGIDRLGSWDLYAPVPQLDRRFSWTEAKKIVVDVFSQFDDCAGSFAEDIFRKKRISAIPKKGKIHSGWSSHIYQPNVSFIMLSFTESLHALNSLAHEVGHCYHWYLSASKNSFLNSWFTLVLAETASTFFELLMLDYLLAQAGKSTKIAFLAKLMDNFRLTAFDMLWRFNFESQTYEAIESGTYLDAETICDLWVSSRTEILGTVVDWTPDSRWLWGGIIHHFMPERRYYNFVYTFGQLLVFVLYSRYRTQGNSFKSEIIKILEAGNSSSPSDILQSAGLDISKQCFWQEGMSFAKQLLMELEKLIQ